jgi:hypothetical protein
LLSGRFFRSQSESDHTKLGFKDAAVLEKAHKAVDLKYLRQTNRMTVWLFRDTVFEHPAKETTAYQTTQYPVKQ